MKIPPQWPGQVKVKISQPKKGILFAELPEYDVFTEANDPFELFSNVNDLIYALFDIPKSLQGKIFYYPSPKIKPFQKTPSSLLFYSLLKENNLDKPYSLC